MDKAAMMEQRKQEYLQIAPPPPIDDFGFTEEPKSSPKEENPWLQKWNGLPTQKKLMFGGGAALIAWHFFGSQPTPPPVAPPIAATEQVAEVGVEVPPEPTIEPELANQRLIQQSINENTIYFNDAVTLEREKFTLLLAQKYIRTLEANKGQQALGDLIMGSIDQRKIKLQKASGNEYIILVSQLEALLVASAIAVPVDNRSDSQRYILEQLVPRALNLQGMELDPTPNAIALKADVLAQQYDFLKANSAEGIAQQELNKNATE